MRARRGDARDFEAAVGAVIGPLSARCDDGLGHSVIVCGPIPGRPAQVLLTSGMASRSPHGRAELMLAADPTMPLMEPDGTPTWPVRMLLGLAASPIWIGRTAANGEPPEPYGPDTELCGALIDQALLIDVSALPIDVFGVIPLHADELEYRLEHGVQALRDRLDEAHISEALHPRRPSIFAAE
jgi:hypothetical protein